MIRKLKWKFVLVNMIIVVLVLGAVFAGIYINTASNLKRNSSEVLSKALEGSPLQGHKKQIGEEYDSEDDLYEGVGSSGAQSEYRAYSVFVVTVDELGIVIGVDDTYITVNDWGTLQEIVTSVLENNTQSGVIGSYELRYLLSETDSGVKIAFADISGENDTLSDLIITSLIVGSIAIAGFFLISLLFARWAVRPIETSWAQQKQFVADASHELKTPLTTISASSDILLAHSDESVKSQSKWIRSIQEEAKRMGELISGMLYLARSDASEQPITLHEIDLSEAVTESLLSFESVIYERGKSVTQNIEENVMIRGNFAEIKQLMMILLDNAVKYSDENGSIHINLQRRQDKALLCIKNDGPAIDPEYLPHLFERFYRPDTSRARESGGYGLGLAIAEKIAAQLHAKITVTSDAQIGTTFCLNFDTIKR